MGEGKAKRKSGQNLSRQSMFLVQFDLHLSIHQIELDSTYWMRSMFQIVHEAIELFVTTKLKKMACIIITRLLAF